MDCPKCQSSNADDSKFCNRCGSRVDEVGMAIDAYLETALEKRLEVFKETDGKDRKVAELEIAANVAERLSSWGKIFAAVVAVPATLIVGFFVFLGYKDFHNFEVRIEAVRSEIEGRIARVAKEADVALEKMRIVTESSQESERAATEVRERAVGLHKQIQEVENQLQQFPILKRDLETASAQVGRLRNLVGKQAVRDFAGTTSALSTLIRNEFAQIHQFCRDQAELFMATMNSANDAPLQACIRNRKELSKFSVQTVEILEDYADRLTTLTRDPVFNEPVRVLDGELRPDVMHSIEASDVSDRSLAVRTLLNSVRTEKNPEKAINSLTLAKGDVIAMAKALRQFFVVEGVDVNRARTASAYENLVSTMAASANSASGVLESAPMRRAEPIRTAELVRLLNARRRQFEARLGGGALPEAIAEAIDAWISVVSKSSDVMFRSDSGALSRDLDRVQLAITNARQVLARITE